MPRFRLDEFNNKTLKVKNKISLYRLFGTYGLRVMKPALSKKNERLFVAAGKSITILKNINIDGVDYFLTSITNKTKFGSDELYCIANLQNFNISNLIKSKIVLPTEQRAEQENKEEDVKQKSNIFVQFGNKLIIAAVVLFGIKIYLDDKGRKK